MPNIFEDVADAIAEEATDLGQVSVTVTPSGGSAFSWSVGIFSRTRELMWQGPDNKGESKLEVVTFKGSGSAYRTGAGRDPLVKVDTISWDGSTWRVQQFSETSSGVFFAITAALDTQISLTGQPGGTAARK